MLLLSTYEEEEYAPRAAECGAAAYIPKAVFGPDRLEAAWAPPVTATERDRPRTVVPRRALTVISSGPDRLDTVRHALQARPVDGRAVEAGPSSVTANESRRSASEATNDRGRARILRQVLQRLEPQK